MQQFNTAKEQCALWGASLRQVQYLCKNGKVAGAHKRGGVWFIPEDTPNPLPRKGERANQFDFIGMKKKVFENAIDLFSKRSFESVSIKDIAAASGIQQSTVYHYFRSKQEILDTIYQYYCFCVVRDRPKLADLLPTIRNGSLLDVILCLRYEFNDEDMRHVASINRIICQRMTMDEGARSIVKKLTIEGGTRFAQDAFELAAKMGRLNGEDAHTLAVMVNGVAIYALFNWMVDQSANSMEKVREEEYALYRYVARYVSDWKAAYNDENE